MPAPSLRLDSRISVHNVLGDIVFIAEPAPTIHTYRWAFITTSFVTVTSYLILMSNLLDSLLLAAVRDYYPLLSYTLAFLNSALLAVQLCKKEIIASSFTQPNDKLFSYYLISYSQPHSQASLLNLSLRLYWKRGYF
jgi:hypothetical protein